MQACEARARFNKPREVKCLVSSNLRYCLLSVVNCGRYYALSARSRKVADLDLATCRVLRRLEGLPNVTTAGVIDSQVLSHDKQDSQAREGVPLSINVYGPVSSADQIGTLLSAASAFLQHPFFLGLSCKKYCNPQMFRSGKEMADLTHLVGLTERDLKAKTISDEVESILGSLDSSTHLGDADLELGSLEDTLRTRLTESVTSHVKQVQRLICF
jgi:SWI/SNF-related matrix-associated actin-dependent regulator of chromatin subfamily A3